MDIADDISYSVHDIEDALVLGIFPLSSLQLMQDDGNLQLVVEIIKQWYGESNQADDIFEARENLQQTGIFDVQFTGSRQSYAKLKNMTSTLIGQFARSITEATRAAYGSDNLVRYQASVVVPRQTRAQINLLKGISAAFVMAPREELSFFEEEKHIIEDLVNYYMHGDGLDEIFRQDYEEAASDSERLRVVIDQIACLTDNSAKQTASSLLGVL
jgi:dGTPase